MDKQKLTLIDNALHAAQGWVKGQRPAAKPVAPEVGRAFQPGGLQVLFAMLGDPAAINLPYRELAQRAQVAHGTAGLGDGRTGAGAARGVGK